LLSALGPAKDPEPILAAPAFGTPPAIEPPMISTPNLEAVLATADEAAANREAEMQQPQTDPAWNSALDRYDAMIRLLEQIADHEGVVIEEARPR